MLPWAVLENHNFVRHATQCGGSKRCDRCAFLLWHHLTLYFARHNLPSKLSKPFAQHNEGHVLKVKIRESYNEWCQIKALMKKGIEKFYKLFIHKVFFCLELIFMFPSYIFLFNTSSSATQTGRFPILSYSFISCFRPYAGIF